MRSKPIAVIAFFLIVTLSQAQEKVKKGKEFNFYNEKILSKIDLKSPDFEKIKFEMRLWVINYANYPHKVYVFRRYMDNTWEIEAVKFCTWDWSVLLDIQKVKLPASRYWVNRWDSLENKQISTIPDQSIVIRKLKSSSDAMPLSTDGVKYTIELLTKKEKRRYSYSNPETLQRYYDLNNQELKKVNQIIDILNNELYFKAAPEINCK